LLHAADEQRRNYKIGPHGFEIHWPDVDEDLTVEGFLCGQPAAPGTVPRNLCGESCPLLSRPLLMDNRQLRTQTDPNGTALVAHISR